MPRPSSASGALLVGDAYIPLIYAPGEAHQFDWSTEVVILHGTTTTVQVAQVRLCHSRVPFVRAYPRRAQEMVSDTHDKAFSFYKGACQRGIYGNMRTAVDALLVGRERQFNRLCPDVQPLPGRADRLHPDLGLGEGQGR